MVELFQINKDGSQFPLRPKNNNNFSSSIDSWLRYMREINKKPIPVQMGIGGGSGFVITYLFAKGTKMVAVFLGCSLLLLQFLNYRGYLHVNRSQIERDLDEIQDQVRSQLGITRSAIPSSNTVSKFISQNAYLLTGFAGGSLIGEEEDDKPPPTAIYVAPFNENAPEFMVLQCYHVERATAAFAAFGMSMAILSFLLVFFEFDWYNHEKGIDVAFLLFLFGYLALGVLIHYYVLVGIKQQISYYLLPFIVVYSILITLGSMFCLGLLYAHYIAKSVEFKVMTPVSTYESTKTRPYFFFLIVGFVTVLVQCIMLLVVIRCRDYLSRKQVHQLELSVAEKSRTANPSIRILIANDNNPPTTYESSAQNPNHTPDDQNNSSTTPGPSERPVQETNGGVPHDPVLSA